MNVREKSIDLRMTLIEGHASVLLVVGEDGRIGDVLYRGLDTRFFETMLVGHLIDEMPRLTPMICGVCSATHHVASVKAVDEALSLKPPDAAVEIRDMINLGIHLNNQAMHQVALGLPDFLPIDHPRRSLLGLAKLNPDLVKIGLDIMEMGYKVVSLYGGREIHPVNGIPGGVAMAPPRSKVEELASLFREKRGKLEEYVRHALSFIESSKDKISKYEPGYTYMMALVGSDGGYDITHGKVVVSDASGTVIEEIPDKGNSYLEKLEEHSVDYSYIRMVSVKGRGGLRDANIHVGALARMNLIKNYGVEEADEIRDRVFEEYGRPARNPLLTHVARVAEIAALYSIIEERLSNAEYEGRELVAHGGTRTGEGVGIIEAPRGTLIHHYKARDGKTTFINIITPTAINAAAIEADLRRVFVGKKPDEMSGREIYYHASAIVRAYDPCMACATHEAVERSCHAILIVDKDLNMIREVKPR